MTTITLPKEQGGTKFGPFPAIPLAIGTDHRQCHLAIHQDSGAEPLHVWLSPAGSDSWLVQPASDIAAVFAIVQGLLVEVESSQTIRGGDSIVLVERDGITLTVGSPLAVQAMEPSSVHHDQIVGSNLSYGPAGGSGIHSGIQSGRGPSAGAIGREVQRQISTNMMTNGTFRQMAQGLFMFRSGALSNPRVIIGGVIAVMVLLGTLCGGIWAWT